MTHWMVEPNLKELPQNSPNAFGEALEFIGRDLIAACPDAGFSPSRISLFYSHLMNFDESTIASWLRGNLKSSHKPMSSTHLLTLLESIFNFQTTEKITVVNEEDLIALIRCAGDQYFKDLKHNVRLLKLICKRKYNSTGKDLINFYEAENHPENDLFLPREAKMRIRNHMKTSEILVIAGPPGFGKTLHLAYAAYLCRHLEELAGLHYLNAKGKTGRELRDELFFQITGLKPEILDMKYDVTQIAQVISSQQRVLLIDNFENADLIDVLRLVDPRTCKIIISTTAPDTINQPSVEKFIFQLEPLSFEKARHYLEGRLDKKKIKEYQNDIKAILQLVFGNPQSFTIAIEYACEYGIDLTLHYLRNYDIQLPGDLHLVKLPILNALIITYEKISNNRLSLLLMAASNVQGARTEDLFQIVTGFNSEEVKILIENGLVAKIDVEGAILINPLVYRIIREDFIKMDFVELMILLRKHQNSLDKINLKNGMSLKETDDLLQSLFTEYIHKLRGTAMVSYPEKMDSIMV